MSTTTFATWLLNQHARTDAIGDLARRAAQDRRFPRERDQLYYHLRWAAEPLRRAAKMAHKEWRAQR